jgi:transcription elongation GreA/GreB family factor
MSRAFVKEGDGEEIYDSLPDRPIDPRPNLVTPEGLTQIDGEIARLRAVQEAATEKADRAALAEATRDMRYWQARRANAEIVPPPDSAEEVRFGLSVTLEGDDGRRLTYRIIGIDEADPAQGSISYVSPLAQALLGKRVGDSVTLGKLGEASILGVDYKQESPL